MLNKLARKKITLVVTKRKPQPVVLTGAALEIKQQLVASLAKCKEERAAFASTQVRPAGIPDTEWTRYLTGELFEIPHPQTH